MQVFDDEQPRLVLGLLKQEVGQGDKEAAFLPFWLKRRGWCHLRQAEREIG